MRKAIAILLTLSICCSFALFAHAETATEEPRVEILFRGIPWGSTHADVQKAIGNLGSYGYKSSYPNPAFCWAGGSKSYHYENDPLHGSFSGPKLSVAGYDMSTQFLFAYTVTDPIKYDTENTAFIAATYNISDLSDPDGVAKDLVEKLSSIYGPFDSTSEGKTLGGYPINYWYWYGANDTFIVLKERNGVGYSYGIADVTIGYGWNGGDEIMDKLDKAISEENKAKEAEKFGNGNTDGL